MKKLAVLFSLLFTMSLLAYSQIYVDKNGNMYDTREKKSTEKEPVTESEKTTQSSGSSFDKSKLMVGGVFGLQFGTNTFINISPQVGYNFSKYMTLGAGVGYIYFRNSFSDFNSSYLGFNLFGHFHPIQQMIISVQPEINHMWRSMNIGGVNYKDSQFVPSFIVGAGVRYQGVMALIQYDVIQNVNTPYGNTIFYTVGYTFNF